MQSGQAAALSMCKLHTMTMQESQKYISYFSRISY